MIKNYSNSKIKVLFLFFLLISSHNIYSQTPESINYQAVMRNNTNIISNQQISIKFKINIVDPSGVLGTLVYSEIHNTQTNNNGLVNLAIGQGTPEPTNAVTFDNIDWGGNN